MCIRDSNDDREGDKSKSADDHDDEDSGSEDGHKNDADHNNEYDSESGDEAEGEATHESADEDNHYDSSDDDDDGAHLSMSSFSEYPGDGYMSTENMTTEDYRRVCGRHAYKLRLALLKVESHSDSDSTPDSTDTNSDTAAYDFGPPGQVDRGTLFYKEVLQNSIDPYLRVPFAFPIQDSWVRDREEWVDVDSVDPVDAGKGSGEMMRDGAVQTLREAVDEDEEYEQEQTVKCLDGSGGDGKDKRVLMLGLN